MKKKCKEIQTHVYMKKKELSHTMKAHHNLVWAEPFPQQWKQTSPMSTDLLL